MNGIERSWITVIPVRVSDRYLNHRKIKVRPGWLLSHAPADDIAVLLGILVRKHPSGVPKTVPPVKSHNQEGKPLKHSNYSLVETTRGFDRTNRILKLTQRSLECTMPAQGIPTVPKDIAGL